jgi:lactoylglutathione lyase
MTFPHERTTPSRVDPPSWHEESLRHWDVERAQTNGRDMIQSAFPIITTSQLGSLIEFYVDRLGGRVTYQFPKGTTPVYVGVELGSSALGISQEEGLSYEGRQRFSLWIYVDSVDETVDALRGSGTPIVAEPEDQPWGERIARVSDPDGNEVIIGVTPGDD